MTVTGEQSDPIPRQARRRDVNGIVLLDKPIGLSSNQALQRVKRIFQARKAGHTGSLDPLASGMLPICLGEATKTAGFLLDSDKTYRFRIALGSQTSTGDTEGELVANGPALISEEDLSRAIESLRGEISQVPPMYSALKHGGERLYRLARAGQEVDRAARTVRIHELLIEQFDPQFPLLRVSCSKGTYVRTLAEDIARLAGTVAHVIELRRLSVTPFLESAMISLPGLEAAGSAGMAQLDKLLLPVDAAIESFSALELTMQQERGILCGQAVFGQVGASCGLLRLYGGGKRFLGVGERLADGQIVPRRLMARPIPVSGPEIGL